MRAAFVLQALPPTGEETTSRVALGRKSALTFLAAPRPMHSSEPTPLGGFGLGAVRWAGGGIRKVTAKFLPRATRDVVFSPAVGEAWAGGGKFWECLDVFLQGGRGFRHGNCWVQVFLWALFVSAGSGSFSFLLASPGFSLGLDSFSGGLCSRACSQNGTNSFHRGGRILYFLRTVFWIAL